MTSKREFFCIILLRFFARIKGAYVYKLSYFWANYIKNTNIKDQHLK